jgi:hypothetical protein
VLREGITAGEMPEVRSSSLRMPAKALSWGKRGGEGQRSRNRVRVISRAVIVVSSLGECCSLGRAVVRLASSAWQTRVFRAVMVHRNALLRYTSAAPARHAEYKPLKDGGSLPMAWKQHGNQERPRRWFDGSFVCLLAHPLARLSVIEKGDGAGERSGK